MAAKIATRWMLRCDIPEVLDIERLSYERAWNEAKIIRALRKRKTCACVTERDSLVIAYCVYELRKHAVRIIKLAVHPDQRRLGVGTSILQHLLRKRPRMYTVIHEENSSAQRFLSAVGFRATRVIRERFHSADGYLFSKNSY